MTIDIEYGTDIPNESELRLIGDVSGGKRTLVLGVTDAYNSVTFAQHEAKSIAVDPDPERIDALRAAAAQHEVQVECHVADLADLGFITSGSVECVVARDTLPGVDDLGRTLRQINRVLRSSRPLIMTVPHPYRATLDHDGRVSTAYGTADRTISDWFTTLGRNNFRVDQILELGQTATRPIPTTLLVRARKEGD